MQTQMSHIKNGENTSCCQHENQKNHVLTRTMYGRDQFLWFSLKKHLPLLYHYLAKGCSSFVVFP